MAWEIDSAHSEIQFAVRHMMLSKVRGRFERFSGTVEFNEQNPAASSVEVQIETDSVNTRQEQRDAHLKSPDFLDAANYPVLTFKSTRIEVVGENEAKIIGDLTIRGETQEATLDVEYSGQSKSPWGTVSAGFTATTKISRKQWGLTWNQVLETGGVLVGDEVEITIDLELAKQVAQAEPAEAVA